MCFLQYVDDHINFASVDIWQMTLSVHDYEKRNNTINIIFTKPRSIRDRLLDTIQAQVDLPGDSLKQ